jgi:hypothetical protein
MSKHSISLEDAALLLKKLTTEAIPVTAFFVSADGSQTKLLGFVDSVTAEVGLVVCGTQGRPSDSSCLRVPIEGADFLFGDKREMKVEHSLREELASRYGEAVLKMNLPSGSVLNLLFTP